MRAATSGRLSLACCCAIPSHPSPYPLYTACTHVQKVRGNQRARAQAATVRGLTPTHHFCFCASAALQVQCE